MLSYDLEGTICHLFADAIQSLPQLDQPRRIITNHPAVCVCTQFWKVTVRP